jgi:hypothetical protein
MIISKYKNPEVCIIPFLKLNGIRHLRWMALHLFRTLVFWSGLIRHLTSWWISYTATKFWILAMACYTTESDVFLVLLTAATVPSSFWVLCTRKKGNGWKPLISYSSKEQLNVKAFSNIALTLYWGLVWCWCIHTLNSVPQDLVAPRQANSMYNRPFWCKPYSPI